jgi:predicted phage tail component-like protein
MFDLTLENKRGEKITLTHRENEYQVISVEGLDPPNAIVTSTTVVGMDGEKYQNSKLGTRNIVITVKINGDVAANRNRLYRYAKTKQYCKVYYKSETHDVFAEGYVETMPVSLFTNNQTVQISIICHDPYFKAVHEIFSDISKILGLFSFPFAFGAAGLVEDTITDAAIEFGQYDENRVVNIINTGAETGVIIEIVVFGGSAINPIIYDVYTRESFALDTELYDGDKVTINTNRGQKSIVVLRNGVELNGLNWLRPKSTWLQLHEGDNLFAYDAQEGANVMSVDFRHRTCFEGV